MSYKQIITNLKRYHQRLNGSTVEYELSFYQNYLQDIKRLSLFLEKKSDEQIKKDSLELINKAAENIDPHKLLIEAYAIVIEAIERILKLHTFDIQVTGGIAMHFGKMIEMQTGEGKTLTAVFPAYLNALSGKGVHVLTFNDYLAKRDADWMSPVYNFLGLSVGYIREGMSIEQRRKAYNSNITYLTAKESGFDYLRDSLCYNSRDIVHRPFNFALVDEADSIMIDEARIPLIIAGTSDEYIDNVNNMSQLAKHLIENEDFEFDKNARNIHLTEEGIKRVEDIFSVKNLFDEENTVKLTRLNSALHAEHLLHRDIDYIIRNGKVELVDEFTGRVADKRRWPDGLQAAIEAKENIPVQSGGKILNSVTMQHFLQLYPKICGMTATAIAAEREFKEFYNLDIVVFPPNKQCIRKDYRDVLFRTKTAKRKALIQEMIKEYNTGRPILIGTRSIEESAELSRDLLNRGIQCNVLNAKNDELEAVIIAQAGKPGAITISTNMAGRGTDIKLGGVNEDEKKNIAALGGLYVIGTNRHESRRIDNQLRGRSGRQGDPGSSRFFISMEDDLFIRYNLIELLPSDYMFNEGCEKIEDPVVIKEIERVQRIIEGQNLEIKKTLYKYSVLIEQQRKIIYAKRNDILNKDSFIEFFKESSPEQFNLLSQNIGKTRVKEICRRIFLLQIDNEWSHYLAQIADIKEGIHLLRLGGQDPIFTFRKQSIELFEHVITNIDLSTIQSFNKLKIKNNDVDLNDTSIKAPSSTWTYLINDNPFENMMGIQLIGNMNLSIGAGVYGYLFVIYALLKKLHSKRKK